MKSSQSRWTAPSASAQLRYRTWVAQKLVQVVCWIMPYKRPSKTTPPAKPLPLYLPADPLQCFELTELNLRAAL